MGKRVGVILVLMLACVIYPATALAKDKTDVSGKFDGEDIHFSATDTKYILKGKIHVENNSDKQIKDLLFVFDYPDELNFPYGEDDPIKLDDIPSDGSLDQDISVNLSKSDIASDHMLSAYLAFEDEDGELKKVAELDGEVDLSVMKGAYTEVDAMVAGQVEQDDGEHYVLDIAVEGTNQSIYDIKPEDELYVAFDLPYDVEVDTERAPKGTTQTIGGGHGMQAIAQIEAKAGDAFEKEYRLPLKGEFKADMVNNLNTKILLLKRYPDKTLEYDDAGAVKGKTDLDFSAMDEENEAEASEAEAEAEDASKEKNEETKEDKEETEAVASSTIDKNESGGYAFFDVPFFVGILGGLFISMLFFVILSGRKKA